MRSSPARRTKDLARALRDVLQAEKQIIRMALGAFNATD